MFVLRKTFYIVSQAHTALSHRRCKRNIYQTVNPGLLGRQRVNDSTGLSHVHWYYLYWVFGET